MANALRNLERSGGEIRIGLVGAGQMGEGLVCQTEKISAMRVAAISSRTNKSCKRAYSSANINSKNIIDTDDPHIADNVINKGQYAIVRDAESLCAMENLDIIVEATGIPEVGARIADLAIKAKKPVIQMNVESDATVGYILRKKAKEAGVIYTLSTGDEPGATMDLYDFATTLGFEVICAGKGKNNIVNRSATPDTVTEKATRFKMNPKMLASFVDGTKTMVEMTSLGNALGFVPDIDGMRGPSVSPETIAECFKPSIDGGILSAKGVVEYGCGIAPGVFVVIRVDHPKALLDFQYLALGDGPYYAFYRPYHLVSLETPIAIYRAVLRKETTIATENPPTCETTLCAKRDLRAGERLDELGGHTFYGWIRKAEKAARDNNLPIGLAPGRVLKRNIRKDAIIGYDDIEDEQPDVIAALRKEQDMLLKKESLLNSNEGVNAF